MFCKNSFMRHTCVSLAVASQLFVFAGIANAEGVTFEQPIEGLKRVDAIVVLDGLGLDYDIRRVPDCGIPDTVVGTIPPIAVGGSVPANEVITLKITTKSGLATVPKVVGKTLAAATTELETNCFSVVSKIINQNGYVVGRCGEGYVSFFPDGGVVDKVIKADPDEEKQVQWTSEVRILRYASGSFKQTRPSVPDNGKQCP
tara:strand:- start:3322 stop:3924 length:603 start_codon:yes stop_codon:yes gene_type:complete